MSGDVDDLVDSMMKDSKGFAEGLGDAGVAISRDEDHAIDGCLFELWQPRRVEGRSVSTYLTRIAEGFGIWEHAVREAIIFDIGSVDPELWRFLSVDAF